MGLSVTFISGPRRSGKSSIIRAMIDELWEVPPHYIRLVAKDGDKKRPKPPPQPPQDCGVATARWVQYQADRVFEVLPEALTEIHKMDRFGSVVIEADADPGMRSAYPYDHRVFVMPVPGAIHEVFRDPDRAAHELQQVLEDTAAFASEIFGLFTREGQEDCDPSEDREDMTAAQMRNFLNSPLGDELATRIQLQQPYHGLVESDVIVVNTDVGDIGPGTDECLRRITRLLERTRRVCGRKEELFLCNPLDLDCETGGKLLDALKPMCAGGT